MAIILTPSAAAIPPLTSRWGQNRRLEFIDFRLQWDGRINRRDLTGFFGISVPQASADIARYIELAPDNLSYDKSGRVYLAADSFNPLYPTSGPTQYLNALLGTASNALDKDSSFLGWAPPVSAVPLPGRHLEVEVLVALTRAMRDAQGIRICYQSLSRPEPFTRTISPHAFGNDGHRWHVRAYCHERRDFRDFVISRILRVEGGASSMAQASDDVAWKTILTLRLAPHPGLSSAHKRAIELDFGMEDGSVGLNCRAALLFYVLRQLRLDGNAEGRPEAQQIVLVNREEVDAIMASIPD